MTESEEEKGNDGFRFSPRPNRAGEINWRPWGRQAFMQAEKEGKLILLSISAVWCHWCHVMDETTYSDQGVIDRVNRDFIPVRVDSDKRPDINRRYNQGGWPTTAFLIPAGRAIAGLTYAPAEQMSALLDRLSVLYRHRKNDIDTEAASQGAKERELIGSAGSSDGIDPGTCAEVEAAILASWDKTYGGLGEAPKFPQADAVMFALAGSSDNGNRSLESFVISTLDGMSAGEINDEIEGGLFRYATARDWSSPHYEKMLSDNAELISVYLAASKALNRPEYAEVARSALDYTMRSLLDDEQRGFRGSQDADEEYYQKDARGREGMEPPLIDRTIYTDSSSKMVTALVLATFILDDQVLLPVAERVADFIWREGFKYGVGLCHYFELPLGLPHLWGQPEDQVSYLQALIDLFQATAEPRFLERAVELGEVVVERYVTDGGWIGEVSDISAGEASDMGVVMDDIPVDLPDIRINGSGARALLMLDELAPGRGFADAATRALRSLAGRYMHYTYFAAGYALAVEILEKGFTEIRVSPECGEELRKDITAAAMSTFHPRKLVRLETVEDYVPVDDDTVAPPAVVCSPGKCLPVNTADELVLALSELSSVEARADTA